MRKAGDSRVQVGCDCSEKCCHSPTSALIASSFASVSMRSLLFLSLLAWQNQPSRSMDPSFISGKHGLRGYSRGCCIHTFT